MKALFKFLPILLISLISLLIISCTTEQEIEPEEPVERTVSFQFEVISESTGFVQSGIESIEDVIVEDGSLMEAPSIGEATVTYGEYPVGFAGWYDAETNELFDFENDTVTKDMTLEARWDGYVETDDGIFIYSPTGLLAWDALATGENEKTYLSVDVTLVADIDLAGYTYTWHPVGAWKGIGTTSYGYEGTFDGAGHTISNLVVNQNSSEYTAGLFGCVGWLSKGTVKNLGLIDADIYNARDYAGAITGYLLQGTIMNCYSTGTVTGAKDYVGGLVGRFYGGTTLSRIIDCYSEATVTGGGRYTGGIVGELTNSAKITACYFSGEVTGDTYVGGIVGNVWYNSSRLQYISACYNTGSVSGNSYVGGIVGYSVDFTTACYSTGSVTGGDTLTGGIAGATGVYTTACYWSGDVTSDRGNGHGANVSDPEDAATKVDGETVTWADAVSAMNEALESLSFDCGYSFIQLRSGALPVLIET